jgi:signal transduction histidine kinase
MKICSLSLFLTLSLFYTASVYSQSDSTAMFQQLEQMADDSNKVLFLLQVGDLFELSDPERGKQYYHQARELAQRLGYDYGVGKSWIYLGYVQNNNGQYAAGFQSNQNAYQIFVGINDSLEMAKSLTNMGNTYLYQSAYELALPYYIEAAEIFEKIKAYPPLLLVLGNINSAYSSLEEGEQQLVYSKRMMAIAPEAGDSVMLSDAYQKYGLALLDLERYEEAKPVLEKAIQLSEQTGDLLSLMIAYSNMGEYYFRQGSYQQAESYFLRCLEKSRELGDPYYLVDILHDLGKTQLKFNRFELANTYLQEALPIAEEGGMMLARLEIYATMARLAEKTNQLQTANYYWERHAMLQDTLYDQDSRNQMAALDIRYQTAQRENQIQNLQTENELQQLRLRQRTIFLFLLLGGIAILSGLIYLLRRSARQKQEINRQSTELQKQEINRLHQENQLIALKASIEGEQRERMRIAEDLHDDFGAGLSKIALLSDILASQDQEKAGSLQKIALASRQLQRKMGEIVWALNTNNDSLASLLSYLRNYIQDFFDGTAIDYQLQIPEQIPDLPLNGEQRRGLFLVIKEALHNVLKHSKAQMVTLAVEPTEDHINIFVRDDGKGFQQGEVSEWSNGLHNMQKRMEQLGGRFTISSKEGTQLLLEVPYNLS